MDKMDKNGMDLGKVNVERLREIFPECVADGKINFDALRAALGDDIDTSKEKYSFNWVGKANAMKIALTPSAGTLIPCLDVNDPKAVGAWNKTENLYIEGDNLEVLKILEKTYHGKIKMIYIDPPYNTGKDFVYHDNFHDNIQNYVENSSQAYRTNPETAGRFHTDWLSMMYPRLKIARELLTDDGVIFISIDDNEQAHIKKMCEEIFGDSNEVAQFIVIRAEGGGMAKQVIKGHDYLYVYAKDLSKFSPLGKPKDIRGKIIEKDGEKYWIQEDWLRKEFGKYGNCHYEEILEYKGQQKLNEINEGIKNGEYILVSKPNGMHVVGRLRNIKDDSTKFYSILKHLSANGVKDLQALGLDKYFDYPKPVSLLYELIEGATIFSKNDGCIILDFFSGSATTAQAVMHLNAKDGGNRKFIMVQLPEECDEKSAAYKDGYKNICDIGKKRIKLAGEKLYENMKKNGYFHRNMGDGTPLTIAKRRKGDDSSDPDYIVNPINIQASFSTLGGVPDEDELKKKNQELADSLDLGFKVFRLDTTNIKPWDATVQYDEQTIFELNEDVIKEGRRDIDVVYEIMLKYGVFNMPLKETVINENTINEKKVYYIGEYLVIALLDEITTEDVLGIANIIPKPKAVVFKESGFVDDNAKINADYTLKRLGIDNVKCI